MKYTLVTTDQGNWQIHRFGCKDVDRIRRQRRANQIWHTDKFETPEALVADELKDELADMGYTEDYFRIMPCCRSAGAH